MQWVEHAVSISTDGVLHGTLTRSAGSAPVPGAVIIAGSGPVDRDGNVPGLTNDSLKHLARALAEGGVATIRTDKRGVGASTWDGLQEEDLRFGTYVRDTVAWAAALRAEPGIGGVALLGHSEGALVATLAAARSGAERLVLLAGSGLPAGPMLERQFSEGGLPDDLRAALHRTLQALAAGQRVADVPPALAPVLRASVQPYLMSWLPLDPAVALSRVQVPVLVVQGTTDIQVGPRDARVLGAARPGAELVLIDGMNHILRRAPADRAGNVATYRDATLPLHPELVPALLRFLAAS